MINIGTSGIILENFLNRRQIFIIMKKHYQQFLKKWENKIMYSLIKIIMEVPSGKVQDRELIGYSWTLRENTKISKRGTICDEITNEKH